MLFAYEQKHIRAAPPAHQMYTTCRTTRNLVAGIPREAPASAAEPLLARLWWLFLIVLIHAMWGVYPVVAR